MLQPYQERVVQERYDLNVKILALSKFFDTPMYASLELFDRSILVRQLNVMREYMEILESRIAGFK
jgi:hypothetical protein